MGWDNASTIAEEVDDPQRMYPRVMILALLAIAASYLIPVAAVWRTHLPASYWSTGSWAGIASQLAGPWIALALVVGAIVSTFGSLNSLTMSYSRVPLAMAEDGYAPRDLYAPFIECGAVGLHRGVRHGVDGGAGVELRPPAHARHSAVRRQPRAGVRGARRPAGARAHLARPFTVPGGMAGAVLAGVGPAALLIVALIRNRHEQMGPISALTVGLALMAAGVPLYFAAAALWRQRRPSAWPISRARLVFENPR